MLRQGDINPLFLPFCFFIVYPSDCPVGLVLLRRTLHLTISISKHDSSFWISIQLKTLVRAFLWSMTCLLPSFPYFIFPRSQRKYISLHYFFYFISVSSWVNRPGHVLLWRACSTWKMLHNWDQKWLEKLKAMISRQFLCLCLVAREKLMHLIYDKKFCEKTRSRE